MSSQRQSLLSQYRYDPLDRLINQTRPETPTLQRFYCKSRLASEIQGAMQYSIIQHGDLLLAQQQRDGDAISATLLATDLQRSVLHTLEKNHQRQSITYSPYGHRPAENGLTSLLGFNGERADPVTGHYLLGNGYRAFNPALMRFNSPDSLSPFGKGGLNSYAYCLGDPVNLGDPTGHSALLHWRSITNRLILDRAIRRVGILSYNRLLQEGSKVSLRISNEILENFKQTYSTIETLNKHLNTPQTLETLALEKFQNLPREIQANAPPSFKNAPKQLAIKRPLNRAQVEKDFNTLKNAAKRDDAGSIIGVTLWNYDSRRFPIDNSPTIQHLRTYYSIIQNRIRMIEGSMFPARNR